MRLNLSIFFILIFVRLFSQESIVFQNMQFGDIANVSIVYAITQDKVGNIWAATEEGVLKFNSHEPTLYNEYEGLPKSFSNRVQNIIVDTLGNIWISADNKLGRFVWNENRFEEIKPKKEGFNLINHIKAQKGKIFVASYNGLWEVDSNTPKDTTLVHQYLKNICVNKLESIKNDLIIATNDGVYLMTDTSNPPILKYPKYNMSCCTIFRDSILIGTRSGQIILSDRVLNHSKVVCQFQKPVTDILVKGENNGFYIATDGQGLFNLAYNFKIISNSIVDVNLPNTITSNGIYDLHTDNLGLVWVATYGGGINRFNTRASPFKHITHLVNNKNSIANNFTRAILETDEGEIWYGTTEGISIYNPSFNSWNHLQKLDGHHKVNSIVMTLAEDKDYIWAGTYGHGAYRIHKKTHQITPYNKNQPKERNIDLEKVYSIIKDSKGTIWFGGIAAEINFLKIDGTIGKVNITQSREIKEGPDGLIYTVGRNGVKYIENDEVKSIESLSTKNNMLNYVTISCIEFEGDNLWLGTNGDGLVRYNQVTSKIDLFNLSNGVPSDVIQGIVIQGHELWASTTNGLIRIDLLKEGDNISVIDVGDGLISNSFNYGSYALLSNDRVAFGSKDGVVIVSPKLISNDAIIPKVVFESIEYLNNRKDNPNSKLSLFPNDNDDIKLNYQQNFINIKYSGIDQLYPNKVNYTWMMEGVNNNWSQMTKKSEINFANLAPGKYIFRVKAINRNGFESSENSISICIAPPWYKSKVAYLIYFFIFLILVYLAYRIAKALLDRQNAEEQVSFYNNITHELKTPLTILLTKLDANQDENINKKEIKTTVKRLNNLFDQLLNFNKITSSFYQDQKISKISFAKHVNLIVASFKNEMEKKNIQFYFDNQWPDEHFYYKRDVLDKITYNLISNAVKYSNQGGVIRLEAKKDQKNDLIITVKDNGIGIPKDQQKDILKRYYRARNAINSQQPGTGLGLMMVKNLVEYDKGSIHFTSEEGLGTSFKVNLKNLESRYTPPARVNDDKIPSETANNNGNNPQKPKILVVEDNDELRIDLVEKLSEHYSIVAARNGAEGLEKALAKIPDLILTDLIMPEMDGNELCRQLQDNDDTNHIPVFMMTVLNSSTQKVESIKSGITEYMTKPIDFPFLVAKINSVLEYKQKLREKYLKETEIQTAHTFKDERETSFIHEMEEFIIERIKEENLSVQDLCKNVGMSRTALYMKLKEMIDQSPQNFIIMTKMNYARKLLLKGGRTVKEVAYEVGFSNPKYFSTSFKKQFDQSPSDFLKSLNP